MIHLAIFVVALAGFAFLLVSMPRHQQDLLGRKLARHISLASRLSGFATLALALSIAGVGHGWAYGAITWFGWLTVAAALTVAASMCRKQITRPAQGARP